MKWGWKSLLFMMMISLLSGCWDYAPLDTKFIVSAIGIDVHEEDPEMLTITAFGVIYEEVNDAITGEGKTIYEGIRDIQKQTERVVSLSHLIVIIFSEDIAKKGIIPYLDTFQRDPLLRNDTFVAISAVKASDMLNSDNYKQALRAELFSQTIISSTTRHKPAIFRSPHLFFTLSGDNHSFSLPYLDLDVTKKNIDYKGLMIFKDGKALTDLGTMEKIGFLAAEGSLQESFFSVKKVKINDREIDQVYLRIFMKKRNLQVTPNQDRLKFKLDYRFTADILEITPWHISRIEEKDKQQLEMRLAEELKKTVEETLLKLQQLQVDPFLFSEYARVKWPEEYDPKKWGEQFETMEFEVEVKVRIDKIGEIF